MTALALVPRVGSSVASRFRISELADDARSLQGVSVSGSIPCGPREVAIH